MAEAFKDSYGPEIAEKIAERLRSVAPDFDSEAFLDDALRGYDALELTERAKQIARALALHLPEDREEALGIVVAAYGPESEGSELTGIDSFLYLPFGYFIAEHGLDCFDTAMRAQYELTKRFTAEFSIRAYLEHHPEKTLARLEEWARDENVHVRRLVSEGTRPRLPWAPRLRAFQRDPSPVLHLLELLKDDPEEYVRRSVANNLNDIAKDHPERVVDVARRWWADADETRRRLVRHALRTLIKAGHEGALGVLGYSMDTPARVYSLDCSPESAAIGGKVRVEAMVTNPSDAAAPVIVDLRIHFVKANGSTSPKVFKGATFELQAGKSRAVRKTISLAQHSTRTHYPGSHEVEVMVNGVSRARSAFDLRAD